MKKPFNTAKYHHFVLIPEAQYAVEQDGKIRDAMGPLSFRTYTDREGVFGKSGMAVQYVVSRNERGRDIGKNFTISQSHNAFMVRETDTDINGTKMYDFIANSPFCEGSPNGTYVTDENGDRHQINVKYRLMNTDADAEVALEATMNRAKAQVSAGELDDQTLVEVAAIGIGYHGEPTKIMRHKVTEWAAKRPNDYFEVLNSGDRLLRATIRKAVQDKVLQVKGELVYWNNQLLGSSEDGAIKFLMENPDTLAALTERVNLKVPEKPKLGKKKS